MSSTVLSPEASPSPEKPPVTDAEKAFFDIDKLEELRIYQRQSLRDDERDHGFENGMKVFESRVDDTIQAFFEREGLTDDYDETPNRKELYELYRNCSIDAVSDREWLISPASRGEDEHDHMCTRVKTMNKLDRRLNGVLEKDPIKDDEESGNENDPKEAPENNGDTDTDNDAEKDAEKERQENLEALAAAKREAYVDRVNAPVYSRKKREAAQQEFDAAEAAYIAALKEDIERDLQNLPDGATDEERKKYIEDAVNRRLNDENAKQHALLIERGGKKAEMLEKYDKMSWKKKLGTVALIGVVGAGAGFAFGLLGAGAATVGGGMIGYRTAKSYYLGTARVYRKPGEADFVYDSDGDSVATDQAVLYSSTQNHERIEHVDATKKRALKWGLGAAALGGAMGLVGTAVHTGAIEIPMSKWGHATPTNDHWKFGYLEHPFDADAPRPSFNNSTDIPNGDGANTVPDPDNNTSGIGVPDNPSERSGGGFDAEAYVKDGVDLRIHAGEGGISLAEHFDGVSKAEMAKQWPEVAAKLDKEYPSLVNRQNGEWRILMPENGKLPQGAAEIIAEHFHSNDMLSGSDAVVGGDSSGTTGLTGSERGVEARSGAGTIEPGEGIVSEMADRGVNNLTQDEINQIGSRLVEEGQGYSSTHLQNQFGNEYGIKMNVPGDGVPAGEYRPDAEKILADFADNRQFDDSVAGGDVLSENSTPQNATESDVADRGTSEAAMPPEQDPTNAPDVSELAQDVPRIKELFEQGNYAAINNDSTLQNTLEYFARTQNLTERTYVNSDTAIMKYDSTIGRFVFNTPPEGIESIPSDLMDIINRNVPGRLR